MFRPPIRLINPVRISRRGFSTKPGDVLELGSRRQLAFAAGGSALAFGTAAWLTNKDTEERSKQKSWSLWGRSHGTGLQPDLARSRFDETVASAKAFMARFPDNRLVTICSEKWIELAQGPHGEAKRTQLGLIAVFVGVFVVGTAARSARLDSWLAHNAASGRSLTLLTSVFAHGSIPHLALNSLALFSLGTSAVAFLDHSEFLPRSTSRYEFLALFAAAGMTSAFASHWWSTRILARRLARTLNPKQVKETSIGSLGASGATYSFITLIALAYPSLSLSFIFLPWVPIPIGAATTAIVLVDIVGLVRGWKLFDHAAHLAGATFGVFYWIAGHELFEIVRVQMLGHGKGRAIE
ncbi:hypothetical protein JCM16303_005938 [Sporobolomyces ruberrimus]